VKTGDKNKKIFRQRKQLAHTLRGFEQGMFRGIQMAGH
jgi:hypothetical protein